MTMFVLCYEGEEGANQAGANAAGANQSAPNAAAPKVFSQEDVNKFLAEDRRKHSQKYEQLEGAYKDALANQNLSTEQRTALEAKLDDLQKTWRSKEQQLEHERKEWEQRYTKDVKQHQEAAAAWENRYKQTLVDRSLQDAAVQHEAFSPSQIVALLRPMTRIVEQTDEQGRGTGNLVPVIDLTDIDTKTGEAITTRRTPEDAVKRMRELPDMFGNLFKANVVSGVGAGAATGSGVPGSGRVDPSKISMDQYMEMRKKNPEALGLKRGR